MKPEQDSASDDGKRQERWVSPALSLGTNIVAGVGLLTFIGYCVDRRYGGGMMYTLIGFGLGLGFMIYEFWKVLSLLNSKPEDDKENDINDKRVGKG